MDKPNLSKNINKHKLTNSVLHIVSETFNYCLSVNVAKNTLDAKKIIQLDK